MAVKTEEEQAHAVVFRVRELLVHQRTQTLNALRGHFAEFGLVAPLGTHNVRRLEEAFTGCEECFPAPAPPAIRLLIERIHDLDSEIGERDPSARSSRDGEQNGRGGTGVHMALRRRARGAGPVQRVFQHDSELGYCYSARRLSFPAPRGLSLGRYSRCRNVSTMSVS